MAARFEDHPEAVAETLALATGCASTSARTSATHRGRRRGRRPQAGRAVLGEDGRALSALATVPRGRAQPPERGAAGDRGVGLPGFFILHRDPAGARARGRGRGARAGTRRGRCCRRAAAAAPRCPRRLLPHRPLAHRPVENQLFLGRFLNEELTSLPDIDLDFPRDVPRCGSRASTTVRRERSALVAAFPTFRSRGAIASSARCSAAAGELERAARGAEPGQCAASRATWSRRRAARGAAAGRRLRPDRDGRAVRDEHGRVAGDGKRARPAKEGDRSQVAEVATKRCPAAGSGWARLCDEAYGRPRHLFPALGG